MVPRDYLSAWDLAREKDWVVGITVDHTSRPVPIVAFERFRRIPWPQIAERIEARAALYPGLDVIDSTGVGDPVREFLKIPVIGMNFAGGLKGKMVTSLMLALESGQIRGPREGSYPRPPTKDNNILHLWKELEHYRWDDENLVQDCVMALAMIAYRLRYWGEMKGHIL